MWANKYLSTKVVLVNLFTSVCSYSPVTYFYTVALVMKYHVSKLSEKQTQCSALRSLFCKLLLLFPSINTGSIHYTLANMYPVYFCCNLYKEILILYTVYCICLTFYFSGLLPKASCGPWKKSKENKTQHACSRQAVLCYS